MTDLPTTHELLRARFAYVRRHLDQALAAVTNDLLAWAPVEGMRTIEGQLFEILGKEIELLTYAKAGGKEEWVEMDEFQIAMIEGWRTLLSETRQRTLAYLDSLSEVDLNTLILFPDGWWEGLYLPAIPLHEIFRSIAAHEWYHTGQLVSYMWSRGGNPYDD